MVCGVSGCSIWFICLVHGSDGDEFRDKPARAIWVGVNALEVSDMAELEVYEPLQVKTQAKSATEASTMLPKIDDIIAASKMKMSEGGPGVRVACPAACLPSSKQMYANLVNGGRP